VAYHIVAYTSNRRWYVSPPSVAGIRWPWHRHGTWLAVVFHDWTELGAFFFVANNDRSYRIHPGCHEPWLGMVGIYLWWVSLKDQAWDGVRAGKAAKKVMLECSVPLLCMWHWVSLLVVEWCSEAFSHTLCSLSSSTFRRSNTEGSVEECQTRCIKIARYLDKWGY